MLKLNKNREVYYEKEKGFTLVELLAVIVILAVILVIAIPQIINVIKSVRIRTLESSAKLIISSAENEWIRNKVLYEDYEVNHIDCNDIVKLNSNDYASCDINVTNEIFNVVLTGKNNGKFNGLMCRGTKEEMQCGNIEEILANTPYLYNVVQRDSLKGLAREYNGNGSDVYNNSVFYYVSLNANNYINLDNNCFRIVRTTKSGGIKVAYVGPAVNKSCSTNLNNIEIAKGAFNESAISPIYVGYMYNDIYAPKIYRPQLSTINVLNRWIGMSADKEILVSNEVSYENGNYTLSNSKNITWGDSYKNIVGFYTCPDLNSNKCDKIYYITATQESWLYYNIGQNGEDDKTLDFTMYAGSEYVLENNKYKLQNIVELKITDWINNFSNFREKYVCSDMKSNICDKVLYVANNNYYQVNLQNLDNDIAFGNSFMYDETTNLYTLVDVDYISAYGRDYNKALKKHYTCLNNDGICAKINYFYVIDKTYGYYIELENGKNQIDALNEMMNNNPNVKDSKTKAIVENWFENNMLKYEKYFEDIVYCNNRQITNYGSWDKDNNLNTMLEFSGKENTIDLECPSKNDSFSVSEEIGNGKLKYPVAILSKSELNGFAIANNSHWFYTMTPIEFQKEARIEYSYYSGGKAPYVLSNNGASIVPVVSLKKGTEFVSGNGTSTSPYVIKLNED